jgi:predicted nucleic acid-binding protein
VRLVVDANILYSVILNTNGAFADVFFNTRPPLELFAPQLLRKELDRHRPRIAKYTGTSVANVTDVIGLIIRRVTLIDPALIADNTWAKAKELTGSVDPDDEDYVALALYLGCPLWTGDKKLTRGLKGSDVTVLSSSEVRQYGKLK